MLVESRRIRDRYRLIEPIGGGAMGTVWRAQDERLDRTVAIKELLLPHDHDEDRTEEAKNRAMREARIAARLQHSHAITVFAVLEEEDRPWLVMEYLPSKSFAVLIQEEPVPVDDAIRVGAQISSALAGAHRVGIVHRDVKPANILVSDDGTAKITDFGISRAIGDVKLTATGEIAGTPAYLAPEIARGEDASFAADVFSLGATLYAAVEGSTPYGTSDNPIALLYKASSGEIEPPVKAERLTPLLLRMLAPEPAERPSMDEVERELRALLTDDEPGEAVLAATIPEAPAAMPASAVIPPPPGEVAAVSPGARKGMIAVGAGAALLCVAVVVAILLVVRQKPPQDNAAPPASPAPSTSASAPTSASPSPTPPPTSAPSTSAPPTSPTISTVASAKNAADALNSYYQLLPGNPAEAWKLLTAHFKASRSQTYDTYTRFWSRFKSVNASGVREVGPNRVTAHVVYDGGQAENDTFTMVQENGVWMIDGQG
ncbi:MULTISPECIES: serine/threonine-protein kinase [unclassified Amycolatopsis]|uniref:serine/threonine-protein kinase n=1 Tax=unclassified Amycolatopsis TaxID=2618356 RepID=UPI002E12C489|nr:MULTISPECIES: serine/threonine-protein kinase [unclassified Amycolatopsis]WSJ74235.1 serine/threonine protein kinase [Amycolatopsis sp. NBC_01307]WSK82116.1 serine/threonine protein kinase [Amycolatopsis sp. NBC_01286]